jgi:DNA-binding IclR family transcriptional regulator
MRQSFTTPSGMALPGDAKPVAPLQTLDRGLQVLSMLSRAENGLTIAAVADGLGVHRAIAYRLAATLEAHGLVARVGGQLRLGVGLLTLAARIEPHLRSIAQPLLQNLAEATQSAAFISMPQGAECVAVMVAEPEGTVLRIAYRVGSRHPLVRGAAGIAILAGRPECADDSDEVRQARAAGVSITRGQLQHGAIGVATPVRAVSSGCFGFEASLGVVTLDERDLKAMTDAVLACARKLAIGVGALS